MEIVVLQPSVTSTLRATQPVVPSVTVATPIAGFTDEYGAKMNLIPAGEFQMGNDANASSADCLRYRSGCQPSWFKEEEPVHTVYLDAFYIDLYEVTNAQYAQCVKAGACTEPEKESSSKRSSYYGNSDFSNYPVINVSWKQAWAFCEWRGAELPTEAQWEKAARGGLEGKLYPWGDEIPVCQEGIDNGANGDDCIEKDTKEVGSYAPNGFGLFDMAGNVEELVFDWYSAEYYVDSPNRNPHGPESGAMRVTRGGSFSNGGYAMRVAWRGGLIYNSWDFYTGFRCTRAP
jgi:formylglycine-generating enzyme required for sulfatase activity